MPRMGALTAEQVAMLQANYSPEEAAAIIAQYGAPAGGYETVSMQVTPTQNLPVESIPANQRIQMTAAQTAAAGAPQTPVASSWSKYALYALVGLGIYFMFIKKPGNDGTREE
jgi:hypothetical protein